MKQLKEREKILQKKSKLKKIGGIHMEEKNIKINFNYNYSNNCNIYNSHNKKLYNNYRVTKQNNTIQRQHKL